nr:CAP domain-containing protein [uncultured Sphingomonas sp.]
MAVPAKGLTMRRSRRSTGKLLLLLAASPLMIGSTGLRTNFDDRLLAAHNRERGAMDVPPLRWDPVLAAGALEWADHLSRSGRFEHSPDEDEGEQVGENIWGGTPLAFAPEKMVGLWIAEKQQFKPGIFPNNSRSGRLADVSHYTQLIWRRTTHVGCATSSAGNEEIMVCRYRTAGNVYGQTVI